MIFTMWFSLRLSGSVWRTPDHLLLRRCQLCCCAFATDQRSRPGDIRIEAVPASGGSDECLELDKVGESARYASVGVVPAASASRPTGTAIWPVFHSA